MHVNSLILEPAHTLNIKPLTLISIFTMHREHPETQFKEFKGFVSLTVVISAASLTGKVTVHYNCIVVT